MGKIRLEITEGNFSRRASASYQLSILIGMDSFGYIISDTHQNILALKDYDFHESPKNEDALKDALEDIYSEDRYLNLSFSTIRVSICGPVFTLIPDRLFNKSEKDTYLDHLTDVPAESIIRADELFSLSVRNVYPVDQKIHSWVKKRFPGAKIYHQATTLLSGWIKQALPSDKKRIFVQLFPKSMTVALFEKGALIFVNSFSFLSAKDFTYYLLLVFEQFDLDPGNVPVEVSGKLVVDSEIYRLITRYIQGLKFLEPSPFFNFGSKLDTHPKHFYFDLLSLLHCN